MVVKEIKICHHDRCITGDLYCPEGNGPFPLIIMSHGYNGHKSDFDKNARYFAEHGIAAYPYTFCGGSNRDESGYPTTCMSVMTEKEDLNAVIDAALTWECIDPACIFLFGASQGGMVSALTAEERMDDVKALILLYPALCIADDWMKKFPNVEDIPQEMDFWGMMLGRRYFMDVRDFDVYANLGGFSKNVFVMHGDQDPIVPLTYSERLASVYKNIELFVFDGEGHGFTPEGKQRMTEMTYEFIRKQK